MTSGDHTIFRNFFLLGLRYYKNYSFVGRKRIPTVTGIVVRITLSVMKGFASLHISNTRCQIIWKTREDPPNFIYGYRSQL